MVEPHLSIKIQTQNMLCVSWACIRLTRPITTFYTL